MRDLANAKRSQSSSPAKDPEPDARIEECAGFGTLAGHRTTPSAVKTQDHSSGDPASHAFEQDRDLIGLGATMFQLAFGGKSGRGVEPIPQAPARE